MAGEYKRIRAALTKQLDARWPDRAVFGEVIPGTGEAMGPDGGPELPETYFFVDITTVEHQTRRGGFTRVPVLVNITAQTKERSRADYYTLQEELDELFRPVFRFGDRAVTVNSATMKIEDGLLHYGFSFSYIPDRDVQLPEDAEAMGGLEVSINDWRL